MQHPVSYRALPGQTDASSWSAATGTSTGFSPSRTMRTKATKAYKANAATECLHSGMVEPKLRTPKASTCQVLSALPSVENDMGVEESGRGGLSSFF